MERQVSVQSAIAYMEAHLEEDLTLERIAAEAGFSAYHFHRMFRRHTGLSIGDYLRAKRLSLASRLLISFGVLLSGEGEVWIDSLRFEEVDLSVPVTSLDTTVQLPDHPMNLQFEE